MSDAGTVGVLALQKERVLETEDALALGSESVLAHAGSLMRLFWTFILCSETPETEEEAACGAWSPVVLVPIFPAGFLNEKPSVLLFFWDDHINHPRVWWAAGA